MIFVTVGTHEQSFNRLIVEIDRLVQMKIIKEDVFIQKGYSDYTPKYCKWENFLGYDAMKFYYANADIIITHGGPASFMNVVAENKIPIVVPRQKKYSEHVNNHQIDFISKLNQINEVAMCVCEIQELQNYLVNFYDYSQRIKKNLKSNNVNFSNSLKKLAEELID